MKNEMIIETNLVVERLSFFLVLFCLCSRQQNKKKGFSNNKKAVN